MFLSNNVIHLSAMAMMAGVLCQCSQAIADEPDTPFAARTIRVEPSADVQYRLQEALINAVSGDTILLAEGTYRFTGEINIVCDNLTLKGSGRDRTVLSFQGQSAGSSGIVATGNAFVIEGLAVEDTAGNAIKVLGSNGVTFRDVRTEWTNGPATENGAYGIYPVECRNVLIEHCVAIGASDAGIYVGQSQDVIVRNCRAEKNVAGIEIENTLRADVYDNVATDNTGGLLVFDLPGLTLSNGGHVRVYDNQIVDNNHANFASKGSIVSEVPPGTGLMLMATDNVEVFSNEITGHHTSNVVLVSYLVTERKFKDPQYDPYPEAASIHDNHIANGGAQPGGRLGTLIGGVLGGTLPDIMYDGIVDEKKLVNGQLPESLRISIRNNGDATFTNIKAADLRPELILAGKYKPETDLTPYELQRAPLSATRLAPHQKAGSHVNSAVAVYRTAPKRLSEWKLFDLVDGHWQPTPNLVRYELNTPLFSDYTLKHRHIRLPDGEHMSWNAAGPLNFPVGTVIAKTFAYPHDAADKTPGERWLETRLEFRKESGWYGYSYVWDEDQTDASLQLGGGVLNVSWQDETGVRHHNEYQIPNANQCIACHGQDNRFSPLGPTAANLNCPGPMDDVNQLDNWVANGILVGAPQTSDRPQLARFDHPQQGSVTDRARAWLEVNCAHCHNPLGSARTSGLDLRVTQSNPARFGVFKSPVAAGKGTGNRTYDIVPGKPEESILMYRLETELSGAKMPNLARNMVHHESNALIREWISAMPAE